MGLEDLYHVTLMSNFARAFDKYSHTYSKSNIPESRFPDQFFLLQRAELAEGIARANSLRQRKGLTGDALLVLRARMAPDSLQPNRSTGVGRFVPQGEIRLDGLARVDEAGALHELSFEEAYAASLHVLTPRLHPYESLVPRTVSLLPVARGCQAACAFCFSEASVSADQRTGRLDLARVRQVLQEGQRRGAERAVLTGGGEPGLLPFAQLLELVRACSAVFPKVVLITNGAFLLDQDRSPTDQRLVELTEAGLSVLAVSCHHHEPERNEAIMKLRIAHDALAATWRRGQERWPRLRLRWVCVLQRGGIDSPQALAEYLDWAADLGVEEVCFKELYVSTSLESPYYSRESNDWSRQHQIPLRLVVDFAQEQLWDEVHRLPWGSPVFRGRIRGRTLHVAAYTEPSLFWERSQGMARSWNLMADGVCLASLEDRASKVCPP